MNYLKYVIKSVFSPASLSFVRLIHKSPHSEANRIEEKFFFLYSVFHLALQTSSTILSFSLPKEICCMVYSTASLVLWFPVGLGHWRASERAQGKKNEVMVFIFPQIPHHCRVTRGLKVLALVKHPVPHKFSGSWFWKLLPPLIPCGLGVIESSPSPSAASTSWIFLYPAPSLDIVIYSKYPVWMCFLTRTLTDTQGRQKTIMDLEAIPLPLNRNLIPRESPNAYYSKPSLLDWQQGPANCFLVLWSYESPITALTNGSLVLVLIAKMKVMSVYQPSHTCEKDQSDLETLSPENLTPTQEGDHLLLIGC